MTSALITNDDGIDSPGLHALAATALRCGLRVRVLAPERQASGTGASLGNTQRDGQVLVEPRQLPGLSEVDAYAVSAHPGFIALAAMTGRFGAVPDIVLSGVNDGANLGVAVPHSGTLGAALVGALHGARAMAVSIAVDDPPGQIHWQTAAAVAEVIVPELAAAPRKSLLNVNLPNVPIAELAPLRRATLGSAGIVQTLTRFMGGLANGRAETIETGGRAERGSDVALLAAGYPTVTSLRFADDGADLELAQRWPQLWSATQQR